MISGRINKILPILGADIISVIVCIVGAYLIRFDFYIAEEYLQNLGNLILVFIPVKIATFYFFGLYGGMYRYTSVWDLINILKATFVSSILLVALFGFVIFFEGIPRSIFLLDYILITLMISFIRISIRIYYTHYHKSINQKNKDTVVIKLLCLGAGNTGEKIAREILSQYKNKYKIVGFLDDNPSKHGSRLHDIPVIGIIDDMPHINVPFDEILITAPSISGLDMRRVINLCKQSGKRFRTVPGFSELIDQEVSIESIRDVSLSDLLGREEVNLDMSAMDKFLKGKRILVTGAGGSIGSELVRQCAVFNPGMLILLDNGEENLFQIDSEINNFTYDITVKSIHGSILDQNVLDDTFKKYRPHVVLHAAAFKHVPLQELFPWNAIRTNIVGSKNLIDFSNKYGVEKFVLVSTDKAVRPVNVMGATKRVAERLVQSVATNNKTIFLAVRFGNVIGSSGSVIPTFKRQIEKGGPVTITHPEMTRYFMSIPEASQLILQAGAVGKKRQIFILDMGKPIKIKDMAFDLIRLSGFEPETDIPVVYTGLRPGEKLYEELHGRNEKIVSTNYKKLLILKDSSMQKPWNILTNEIDELNTKADLLDSEGIKTSLKKMIPDYQPQTTVMTDEKSDEIEKYMIRAEA